MPFTQANRPIAIATPLGEDVLLLKAFTGYEGISRLFNFRLDLLSDNHAISFKDIIGKNVTLRVVLDDDGKERFFNGYVSRFRQSGSDARFTHYHMEVVPWTWFLTQCAGCRIFQKKSIPDIVQQIFKDRGLNDFRVSLMSTYDPLDYCVQYRETDFNFVSRLMERCGIFYFFEHENGKHTMVLADSPSAHQPCPERASFQYNAVVGADHAEDVVNSLHAEQELRTGTYAFTDYNFETPSASLLSSEQTVVDVSKNFPFEIYDYPGVFLTQSQGSALAKIRMEEQEAPHKTISGGGVCRVFTSGYKFDLEGHYRDDMNDSYVLTEVHHVASVGESYEVTGSGGGATYSNEFRCIPASIPFRPPRMTPTPVIPGPQTAVVVGPTGEEIYTDKYGRVKVVFHWDREGKEKEDENCSCWVRVSQPWAGKNWGAMSIPRIGQEVIVEFLEGDPDHPIITGRVYNAEQMPAYTLPDEHTKTYFKSMSSKGGGGFNELRFEDKKGDEQVFMHAEKNLDIRVKNNAYETVVKDSHLIVEQDRFEHLKHDCHLKIDNDQVESVGRDHHLKVSGKQTIAVSGTQSLKVDGDVAEQFGSNHSEQVSQSLYLKAGMTAVIEAPMGVTLKCGGNAVVVDPVGVTLSSSGLITIQGSMVLINSGPGSPPGVGMPGMLVPPMSPKDADEADKADPGQMAQLKQEQMQTKTGKYGSTPIKPFKPGVLSGGGTAAAGTSPSKPPHFIEIEMVDEDGNPVPGEQYQITLPDGSVASGTLDAKGTARVDGIEPGTCKVTFPKLDESAWKPK